LKPVVIVVMAKVLHKHSTLRTTKILFTRVSILILEHTHLQHSIRYR